MVLGCLESSFEQHEVDLLVGPLISRDHFIRSFPRFFFFFSILLRRCKNSTTKERERGKELQRNLHPPLILYGNVTQHLLSCSLVFKSHYLRPPPRDKIIQRAATLPRIRQLCKK